MKNYAFCMNDREHNAAVRNVAALYRDALSALEDAKRDTQSPRDTVRVCVEKIGTPRTVAIVATIVNRSAWDGRISPRNADWARSVEDCLDEETANRFQLWTKIHLAHVDQIADAMRRATL